MQPRNRGSLSRRWGPIFLPVAPTKVRDIGVNPRLVLPTEMGSEETNREKDIYRLLPTDVLQISIRRPYQYENISSPYKRNEIQEIYFRRKLHHALCKAPSDIGLIFPFRSVIQKSHDGDSNSRYRASTKRLLSPETIFLISRCENSYNAIRKTSICLGTSKSSRRL